MRRGRWLRQEPVAFVCFQLFRSLKLQGLKLSEGDFVKLGRVRFKIKELRLSNEEEMGSNRNMLNSSAVGNFIEQNVAGQAPKKEGFLRKNSQNSENSTGLVCRICLCEDEEDNPLISPCKCSGSMQYIHIECLQKWLANRLNAKTTNYSVSFSLKNFECELCKAIFPGTPQLIASFNLALFFHPFSFFHHQWQETRLNYNQEIRAPLFSF